MTCSTGKTTFQTNDTGLDAKTVTDADASTTTDSVPDWGALLRSWDQQQEGYVPERERIISTMADAVETVLGRAPRILDLGCGPGTVSQRLVERFPDAEAVALDIDPLLLGIGRGALGDMGGRLTWVDADLRSPDWTRLVGEAPFDVVTSTTALHWFAPSELADLYDAVASVLRPGGLLLNADRFQFDRSSPATRQLCAALRETREEQAFTTGDRQDWLLWWESLSRFPALEPLLQERRERFDARPKKKRPGTTTSLAFHTAALGEAGFDEVETIWQDLSRRLLLAVRADD